MAKSISGVDYAQLPTASTADAIKIITQHVNTKKGNVLISGPSGVGKTWFVSQLGSSNVKLFSLDKFGSRVDSKWVVKIDSLPKEKNLIFEGTCNNLKDVIAFIKPTLIVYLTATPDLFRRIQAVKHSEALEKDLPTSWTAGWLEHSEQSDDEIAQFFKDYYFKLNSDLPSDAERLIVINNSDANIKRGWH